MKFQLFYWPVRKAEDWREMRNFCLRQYSHFQDDFILLKLPESILIFLSYLNFVIPVGHNNNGPIEVQNSKKLKDSGW